MLTECCAAWIFLFNLTAAFVDDVDSGKIVLVDLIVGGKFELINHFPAEQQFYVKNIPRENDTERNRLVKLDTVTEICVPKTLYLPIARSSLKLRPLHSDLLASNSHGEISRRVSVALAFDPNA